MDGTLPAGARHDLTDEQWAILASLLPVGRKPGRPRRWTLRQLIDGIRFRTRTGCPWRDVPERYGTWQSVYGLFRAWQLAGTWAAILTGLQAMSAEAGLIKWVVSVDSTINRAHQHAAGARRHPEDQAEPQGLGKVAYWGVTCAWADSDHGVRAGTSSCRRMRVLKPSPTVRARTRDGIFPCPRGRRADACGAAR